MADDKENTAKNEFHGAQPRVFGTNPDNPEEGRIFIWTITGWFERMEGESGDVAFAPVAQSEDELHQFISRDDPSVDLVLLGEEYRKMVSEEFFEQSPSYQESPEYSEEEPTEDDDQQYHQHD